MNQSNDQDFPSLEHFTRAIQNSNVEDIKKLVKQTPRLWREIKIRGYTLLQLVILENRRDVFTCLLEFSDCEYLETLSDEGATALNIALITAVSSHTNYVTDLLEKYETIPKHYNDKLLHWSVEMGALDTLEYLLKKGINPNMTHVSDGVTPLHTVVTADDTYDNYRTASALLYYGADTLLKVREWYVFEVAVLCEQSMEVQELLFNYTFDKVQNYQIHFTVLLYLARLQSPLFDRILEYDVEFVFEDLPACYLTLYPKVTLLFSIENEYAQILIEKHYSLVYRSFQESCDLFWREDVEEFYEHRNFVEKVNMFIESGDAMRNLIVYSIASIKSWYFFNEVFGHEESVATEIVIFMAQYGLHIPSEAFDLVYDAYGYCDLFKFFLKMDYDATCSNMKRTLIVSLIRDIHDDLDSVFVKGPSFYSSERLLEVLDFFAHKKLQQFLLQKIQNEAISMEDAHSEFSEKDLQKIREHPQVPRLEELARNALRRYLIERFHIETTRQFYCLVESLHMSTTYKKIICLETKLYQDELVQFHTNGREEWNSYLW